MRFGYKFALKNLTGDQKAYCSEIDKDCCDWISNLMDAGLVMPGFKKFTFPQEFGVNMPELKKDERPTVTGVILCEVRVQCPGCKWGFLNLTQMPYDPDGDYAPGCDILGPVFGGTDSPAKWSGLDLEYTCCMCKQVFVVDRLEARYPWQAGQQKP